MESNESRPVIVNRHYGESKSSESSISSYSSKSPRINELEQSLRNLKEQLRLEKELLELEEKREKILRKINTYRR